MIRYYFTAYIANEPKPIQYIADTTRGIYIAKDMIITRIKQQYPSRTFILSYDSHKVLIPEAV